MTTPVDFSGLDAAIVDLDGTLLDTLDDFVAALNGMLGDLALPQLARAQVEPLVGKGSEHLVRSVLAALDADPVRYDAAFALYQQHYGQVNGLYAQVYPGALEGLQALRARGLRLVCLTNKPVGFARALLQQKGLATYFEQVFGGDSFARKKPDPLPVQQSCAALGSLPARTLMIGDSSNDARAARAAGCPVVLVSYGYNHGVPVCEVDADGYVDALSELGLQGATAAQLR